MHRHIIIVGKQVDVLSQGCETTASEVIVSVSEETLQGTISVYLSLA